MGDPIDDSCGPRPLRLGSFQEILRDHYLPAMEEQIAKPMFLWGGPREPSYWAESHRMRRAWPRLVLFPRLERLEWKRVRLRDRFTCAWWAAKEAWDEHG